MCGITGFYGFEDRNLLREMTKLLEHRGPDQSGYYSDEWVSLGHRRLSIIDLSEDGKQPMSNEDDTVWIIFNGEIYNYKELRVKLEEKKHTFKSKTDTEVIIHAYEEYREKCVELLNGDFAFAVYDAKKKSLFLARDRLGIKPLYYTLVNGHFYFASEIKAILASPEVNRHVNVRALNYYLTFFANSLAETMFQGIYKLLPGHTLWFEKGKITIHKYWDLEMKPQKMSLSTAQEELQQLLRDSVQKRLMSDVPLGVYLSGGIDSGSVVSLMSTSSEKIKTFSVGFEGHSELSQAKITADYFNTDHKELILQTDAIKALPDVVWHQDEPMGDPTSIPTYFLSQEAKKKVTVVLTGEGADEQFAGYEQEKFVMMHQQYVRKLPVWMRKSMLLPLQKLPAQSLTPLFKYMGALGEEGKRRVQEFVTAQEQQEALMKIISLFSDEEKEDVAGKKLLPEVKSHSVTTEMGKQYFSNGKNTTKNNGTKNDLLAKLLRFENKVPLAENLLMKVDKNTMAFGIEARVPYLDHCVVEFAARMPSEFKLKGWQDKYILRRMMKDLLPPKKAEQKKERFFVPVDHWLKEELGTLSEELLSKKRLEKQGYFNPAYIEKMMKRYDHSPLFYGRQMWTLLNFQLWHKMFIEKEKVKI